MVSARGNSAPLQGPLAMSEGVLLAGRVAAKYPSVWRTAPYSKEFPRCQRSHDGESLPGSVQAAPVLAVIRAAKLPAPVTRAGLTRHHRGSRCGRWHPGFSSALRATAQGFCATSLLKGLTSPSARRQSLELPLVGHLTSPALSFLFCKMGIPFSWGCFKT